MLFGIPFLLAWPLAGAAQAQAPQPQLLSVSVVHVKPDMLTEFQTFVKNDLNPALQKGGIKQREVFATAAFGEAFEYVFVTPISSFAQYDGETPLVKAVGRDGARSLLDKARRCTSSLSTYAMRTRPDLSIIGKTAGPPKLFVVTWISVAPGRGQDFESYFKNDMLPVIKRAQVSQYLVSQVVLGGEARYVILTAQDRFADLDRGSLFVQVLGQEGANKLLQKGAPFITHVERSVVRFVPELSITPPVQAENK